LLAHGAWRGYPPAGFIAAGAVFVCAALLGAK